MVCTDKVYVISYYLISSVRYYLSTPHRQLATRHMTPECDRHMRKCVYVTMSDSKNAYVYIDNALEIST